MTPTEALLHRASYHAEKLLRRRGNFNSVLWLVERVAGHRQMFEAWCDAAPTTTSDVEVLAALAAEMGEDYRSSGAVRFGVAFLAHRVTRSAPVEKTFLLKPVEMRRQGCD